jgi:hypothetical protein
VLHSAGLRLSSSSSPRRNTRGNLISSLLSTITKFHREICNSRTSVFDGLHSEPLRHKFSPRVRATDPAAHVDVISRYKNV